MDRVYNFYNLEASFKNYLLAGNIKLVSLKNYLSDFRHFIGWLIFKLKVKNESLKVEKTPFSTISPYIDSPLIEEYRSYLCENKIPVKTINRRLSTIRKFCSFCISQGWIKENPAKRVSNVLPSKEISRLARNNILNQFEKDLIKENLDRPMITNLLNHVQEFLSS